MKYFIDTEFIEGFHKPLFGKRRHFIDLISIGIVAEDGREYHAISNEYNYYKANEWVQKNVIIPMYVDTVHGDNRNRYDAANFQYAYGKSNKQIALEVLEFTKCWRDVLFWRASNDAPEFYGFYSDYDWVLFCSLFGHMYDLPKGFPMYCRDLKQMFDEKANSLSYAQLSMLAYPSVTHNVYAQFESTNEDKINLLRNAKYYPKIQNEHNALADARWNFELYKFLTNL